MKVRAEAQKVKAGDEVSGPREVERLEVSRARNDKQAAARGEQCNDEERQGCHQVVRHQRQVHNVTELGESESDAVQGNESPKKLCNQRCVPVCAVRRRRCRLCQNEKFLSEKLKCIAQEVSKRMADEKPQRR